MGDAMCSRHPEEKLRFVCVQCDTPICRDCKLTQHEGHDTTDVDLFASRLREKLSREKDKVETDLKRVRELRNESRASVEEFEKTLEEAKSAMSKKLEAVIEWAKTYRLAADAQFRALKVKRNEEIDSAMDYMEENVRYFSQLSEAMTFALSSTSDQYVLKFYTDYMKNHEGKYPTVSELKRSIPSHTMRAVTTSTRPDRCQKAVERYLGIPLIGAVRKTKSNLSMCSVPRLTCSEEDECVVTAILPAHDGTVSVLYQNCSSGSTGSRLAVFTEEGRKRSDEAVDNDDVIMVDSGSTSLRLFSPGSESFQHVSTAAGMSLANDEPDQVKSKVYYLKRRDPNRYPAICELDCSRPWNVDPATAIPVADTDVDDGVKVAANAKGRVFAVITKSNQIRVYQRHAGPSHKDKVTIFDVSEHMENAYLSDVCFCSMDGVGEVLVVAEAQYSVLLVVDYHQDLQLRSFFPSPRPGPSAICCDSAGVLWVGCEGGEVFMCLSGSGDKDTADLDEDEEGYLLPAEEIYANILALSLGDSSGSSVEDTPPERPPRRPQDPSPPVPDRPGTDRPAGKAEEGSSIPLKPPAKRAPAVSKSSVTHGRSTVRRLGRVTGGVRKESYEVLNTPDSRRQQYDQLESDAKDTPQAPGRPPKPGVVSEGDGAQAGGPRVVRVPTTRNTDKKDSAQFTGERRPAGSAKEPWTPTPKSQPGRKGQTL